MAEWKELKTLQDLAAAQAAGDKIQVCIVKGWKKWDGRDWFTIFKYRSRAKSEGKKIKVEE